MQAEKVHITARCPIRTTLELVGGKWKLLLLFQLNQGNFRFKELKQNIPDISEKMLAQELNILIDSQLVHKAVKEGRSASTEYSITRKGELVMPLIREMKNFAVGYSKD